MKKSNKEPKHIIFVIGFILLANTIFPRVSFATDQQRETVDYEGKQYVMNETPLYSYLENQKPPIQFDRRDTAHWRGYQASWEIKNQDLFLTALDARINGKETKAADIFHSLNAFPVKATWYTGKLTLSIGEVQGYWREKVITLTEGTVQTVQDINHKTKPALATNAISHWATIFFIPVVFLLLPFCKQKNRQSSDQMLLGIKIIISVMIASVLSDMLYLIADVIYTNPGYYIDHGNLRIEPVITLPQKLLNSIGFFIISSIVPSILSWGLSGLKSWARTGLVIIAFLMLAANLVALTVTFYAPVKVEVVQVVLIIFSAGCLVYLFQPKVKVVFLANQKKMNDKRKIVES